MVQELRRRRASVIGLRANAPKFARVLALLVLIAGVVYVVAVYYHRRDLKDFRLRQGPAELSTEVVGVVEGYERRVTEGDRLKLWLRAARDITFSDGHHELEDVHLEVYPETGDRPDKISARRAIYDQEKSEASFMGAVHIETRDQLVAQTEAVIYNQKNETAHATAPVNFERENVRGRADTAIVDARNKKLDMQGSVEVTVHPNQKNEQPTPRSRPVTIKSAQAHFDQASLNLSFMGGATAEQERDVMSGDTLAGTLNQQKRLQKIEARGNSYLRTMEQGRAAEVHAVNMDFFFDGDQQLERAVAAQNVRARSLDADSEWQMSTGGDLNVDFNAQGERSLLKEMRAGGRPVVTLAAPKSQANDPRAANKRLTADEVKLFWRASGRDLERLEASGNAELFVDPLRQDAAADRKTLYAPRFDGEFYESGNHARLFTASGGAKAVVDPVQPTPERGTRTLTSQRMVASFARQTQAVEKIDALGDARFNERERTMTSQNMFAFFNADQQALERIETQGGTKFNELDRNAQAANATYTTGDGIVRLRGGEPVAWDSRARMKASEIDSDTRNKVSYGRGKATTTYYNQEQTGGAAPFAKIKSPVFIVSNTAELRHETGVGIYTGNARMWQDDNFVRAERIVLYRDQRRMEAESGVQSALYNARRKDADGGRSVVPVFATANRMTYADPDRLVHYEGNVDIKQGTERITSEVADVYLLKESYEVERTVAQRSVVVTQPGKRGTGDWAQYTAADETVVLTGAPARVEDAEQGTSQSRRLTVHLRDNRVVSDGGESRQSSGRVRSTHKVKKQ